MQVLRAGERIIYKIPASHVSQKAIAGVTWNRLPQLSGPSAKTVHKSTVKKRMCEINTKWRKDLDAALHLEAVNLL
jgi:hypothetical protein